MNERLKELRKTLNLTQEGFAERLGIKRNTLANYEIGRNEPIDAVVSLICREFNVNERWLRTGEGEMFVQPSTFSLDELAKKNNLTPLELDIVKDYMELNEKTRHGLLAYFRNTFSKHAETAATIPPQSVSSEDYINNEVEAYRQELEAKEKARSVSVIGKEKKA